MNPTYMKALAVVGTVCAAALLLGTTTNIYSPQNLFSVSPRDPALQKEIEREFVNFIAKYGKSYASKSEVPQRFELFAQNYMLIKEHNAKGEAVTFTMAMNHMGDMHESEIKRNVEINEEILMEFKKNSQLK